MLKTYSNQLEDVTNRVATIAEDIYEANKIILQGLQECNKEVVESAKERLNNMSSKTVEIDNMIVKMLALYSPEAKDLRLVVSFLKITNELLRASSNTRSFVKGLSSYCKELDKDTISEYAIPLQKATVECLLGIVEMVKTTCSDETQEIFNRVLISESKTDDLYEILQDHIIKQADQSEDFGKFTRILSALRKSEKIADRALDIASLLLFAKIGGEIGLVD